MKLISKFRPLWLSIAALGALMSVSGAQVVPAPPIVVPAATPTAFTPPSATPAAPTTVVVPVAPAPAVAPTPTPTPANPVTPPMALKLFGREMFEGATNSFEPNPDTPVPSNYVLGPGDTVAVLVWNGASEFERTNATITPSGNIYLKLIGVVPLAEKTLGQVEAELQDRYARFYKRFNLRIQVVGRRTIPVFVVGEVAKPGKYLLSSLSTVFGALYAAGGPTETGSLRTIRLVRRQLTVGTVDVYKYLINGVAVDLPLRAGDTVFVPVAGKVVTIAGEVRRPAKYELLGRETLQNALDLAGGPTANSTGRIRLSRVDATHRRTITELVLPAAGTTTLRDGDELTLTSVLSQLGNAVYLTGAVNRPGSYAIDQAPTVGALLKRGDGLSPEAYAEQAVIIRRSQTLERSQITVNLRAILAGEPNSDVTLQPEDILRVFGRNELSELPDLVTIQGEVLKPGTYPFQAGMHVADLMRLAFGPTTRAYLPQAQIYRYTPGRQPEQLTVDLAKAIAGDAANNLPLRGRDTLMVRSREDVKDQVVRVEGEVYKPGTFPFYGGMKVSDAIFAAGGLKPDIALDQAWLVRLNEKTFAEELISINLREVQVRNPKEDILLQNQDRLIVYPVTQMGEFRQVRVEGAVRKPSVFPYFGGMRIDQLVFFAEGLQDNAYTERADLYRFLPDNTTQITPIDLTKAMAGGNNPDNPLVEPRDRLVIYTREKMQEPQTVKIDGYVRQPGQYPLTEGMKLSDLLHLSGGLRPDAQPRLDVYRVTNGKVEVLQVPVVVDKEKDTAVPSKDMVLQTRDLISVQGNAEFFNVTETVSIEGAVLHPGTYPAYTTTRQNPKTLYQMVAEVGGLLPDAYPKGLVLYRKQSIIHTDRQKQELERTLRDIDTNVGLVTPPRNGSSAGTTGATAAAGTTNAEGTSSGSAGAVGSTGTATTKTNSVVGTDDTRSQNIANISRTLAQVLVTNKGNSVTLVTPPRSMQEQQVSLSVPVDGEAIVRTQGREGNLTLEPGDVLFVPKRPTTVTIVGGIVNNGSVLYQEGQGLNYYYNAAGGVSPDGDSKRTVVMRLNGRVLPMKQVKTIEPGDIIVVPTKFTTNTIHTQSTLERSLQSLSETVLSFVPFIAIK